MSFKIRYYPNNHNDRESSTRRWVRRAWKILIGCFLVIGFNKTMMAESFGVMDRVEFLMLTLFFAPYLVITTLIGYETLSRLWLVARKVLIAGLMPILLFVIGTVALSLQPNIQPALPSYNTGAFDHINWWHYSAAITYGFPVPFVLFLTKATSKQLVLDFPSFMMDCWIWATGLIVIWAAEKKLVGKTQP